MQKLCKMKSYGLAAIQCDWCPSKRRAYTEERPHENIGRKQNLQVKEISGLGRNQCAYLDLDLLSSTQKGESELLLLTYLVCGSNSSKHKSQ